MSIDDDEAIPPPPPGRGEWLDWDGTDAAIGDGSDGIESDVLLMGMLNTVNDDDDINNYIITNKKDDKVKNKDIKKNKIVKTVLKKKNKDETNFNDDDYDDRVTINITKGDGAFSPSGKNNDLTFSNRDTRGPMDDWGAGYSEESPYFDEEDIIEDWSDRKGTFSSSMSSDLFAKPNIDDLIKSTSNEQSNTIDTNPPSTIEKTFAAHAQTSVEVSSLLTITNEMNRRLNEIEMKATIQYQDLKIFYCAVSAIQFIIILLLIKS